MATPVTAAVLVPTDADLVTLRPIILGGIRRTWEQKGVVAAPGTVIVTPERIICVSGATPETVRTELLKGRYVTPAVLQSPDFATALKNNVTSAVFANPQIINTILARWRVAPTNLGAVFAAITAALETSITPQQAAPLVGAQGIEYKVAVSPAGTTVAVNTDIRNPNVCADLAHAQENYVTDALLALAAGVLRNNAGFQRLIPSSPQGVQETRQFMLVTGQEGGIPPWLWLVIAIIIIIVIVAIVYFVVMWARRNRAAKAALVGEGIAPLTSGNIVV